MTTETSSSCPECSGMLDASEAETVCVNCGLIVTQDWIDPGPEWRSFGETDRDRRRTGAPLTRSRHDRGLSTEIGHGGGRGLRLTGRKRRQVARMRREHRRAQCRSKAERNRRDVYMQIKRIVGALSLPSAIHEGTCTLFRSAQNEGLVQGRSLEGFTAATVYGACRVHGYPRTMAEVLEVSRASGSELRAAYGALNRELGLPVGPIPPADYVPRFGTRLDLPVGVRTRAEGLIADAREAGVIRGRNPCGVAAACLYTAANEREADLTQVDAAGVADVSTATIRSMLDDLRDEGLTTV